MTNYLTASLPAPSRRIAATARCQSQASSSHVSPFACMTRGQAAKFFNNSCCRCVDITTSVFIASQKQFPYNCRPGGSRVDGALIHACAEDTFRFSRRYRLAVDRVLGFKYSYVDREVLLLLFNGNGNFFFSCGSSYSVAPLRDSLEST